MSYDSTSRKFNSKAYIERIALLERNRLGAEAEFVSPRLRGHSVLNGRVIEPGRIDAKNSMLEAANFDAIEKTDSNYR